MQSHTHIHFNAQMHEYTHTHAQIQVFTQIRKSTVEERPQDFDACIMWARLLFQEYFHNTIAQLLHIFPPDHVSGSCDSHVMCNETFFDCV